MNVLTEPTMEVIQGPHEFWSEGLRQLQPKLTELWKQLSDLKRTIPVGASIDAPVTSVAISEHVKKQPLELVVNLPKGKLIAIFEKNPQFEEYTLVHLAQDAVYTTYAAKPIYINNDTKSYILPSAVHIEKWPHGFRIDTFGSHQWFYHIGKASYKELPEEIAQTAYKLAEQRNAIDHKYKP